MQCCPAITAVSKRSSRGAAGIVLPQELPYILRWHCCFGPLLTVKSASHGSSRVVAAPNDRSMLILEAGIKCAFVPRMIDEK
jgi:hypothetical protein